MSSTDFQALYYRLVTKQLRRLLDIAELDSSVRDEVTEYIEHNELGMAFELIKDGVDSANASDEIKAQINILSDFLS